MWSILRWNSRRGAEEQRARPPCINPDPRAPMPPRVAAQWAGVTQRRNICYRCRCQGDPPVLHGAYLTWSGLAAGDLVVAQYLEEVQVAELLGAGLGQAGVEGIEHPGQLQGAKVSCRAGFRTLIGLLRSAGGWEVAARV